MNEKGESLSLCKAEWSFKGTKIKAPLAVEDRRMLPKNRTLEKWIETIVLEKIREDTVYASLICLPGIITNKKPIYKELAQKWDKCDFKTIVLDIKKEKNICDQMGILPLDLTPLTETWEKKLDYDNPEEVLEQLNDAISVELVSKRSMVYMEIVRKVIDKIEKPKNYSELIGISQKLGISGYEDTLAIADIEDELYTNDVIEDVLRAIIRGDDIRIPLWFKWDIFFTDYVDCLKCIEAHIDNLSLFMTIEESEVKKAISVCPNIGSLQMYFAELLSKNAYLMEQGINTFSIMKKEDADRTDVFFENLKKIEIYLKKYIDTEYTSVRANEIKKGKIEKQKVYVLDTCALIHKPRIFLYFDDDEYVRIPTKVIDEIGKIKDRRSDKYSPDTATTARVLARSIREEYLGLFNAKNKIRLLIENADTNLLPADLDPSVPDNQILSVALKYSDCDTVIISDDTVFQLASLSQDVKAMTGDEFVESHREYYKSLDTWKNMVKSRPPVIVPNLDTYSTNMNTKAVITEQKEISIDELPIKELAKYASELTNPMMSFLNTNSIKTIGQVRALTPEKIDALKAKGSQAVYKNTLKYMVARIDQILDKMKTDLKGKKEEK